MKVRERLALALACFSIVILVVWVDDLRSSLAQQPWLTKAEADVLYVKQGGDTLRGAYTFANGPFIVVGGPGGDGVIFQASPLNPYGKAGIAFQDALGNNVGQILCHDHAGVGPQCSIYVQQAGSLEKVSDFSYQFVRFEGEVTYLFPDGTRVKWTEGDTPGQMILWLANNWTEWERWPKP